jgi:hypothetical protein
MTPSRDPGSSRAGEERVLAVEDWAEIRRLHRVEQMPIKVIARVMGIAKNKVRAAMCSAALRGTSRFDFDLGT